VTIETRHKNNIRKIITKHYETCNLSIELNSTHNFPTLLKLIQEFIFKNIKFVTCIIIQNVTDIFVDLQH